MSFCRQALLSACQAPACICSGTVALIWLGHLSSAGPPCPPWVKCFRVRTMQVELLLSFRVPLWSFSPSHSAPVSPGTQLWPCRLCQVNLWTAEEFGLQTMPEQHHQTRHLPPTHTMTSTTLPDLRENEVITPWCRC